MGIFDSKSSSETNPITNNAAFSEIAGAAQSIALNFGKRSKGNTVNVLDAGAISGAFGFAGQALNQVELAGSRASQAFDKAINAVTEASRGEGENLALTVAKWGAIVAGIYLVVRALKG